MKKAGRPIEPVLLTQEEEQELERRVNASRSSKRDSRRSEDTREITPRPKET